MSILQTIRGMNRKSDLPLISLNKLEEDFIYARRSHSKFAILPQNDNIQEFKVSSPFY